MQSFHSLLLLLLLNLVRSLHLRRLLPSIPIVPISPIPPPSKWLPVGVSENRKDRTETPEESMQWAKDGSQDIPKIENTLSTDKTDRKDDDKKEGTIQEEAVSNEIYPSAANRNDKKEGTIQEETISNALMSHPEIYPSAENRNGDGSLGMLYNKINNMEALEKRTVGVGEHMSDLYPSKWAGDDDVNVENGKDGKNRKDRKNEKNEKEDDDISSTSRLYGMLAPGATGSVGSNERKQAKVFHTIWNRAKKKRNNNKIVKKEYSWEGKLK